MLCKELDLQPCFAALALTQHALACYLAWHVLFGQSHLLLAFGLHVHAGLKITLSNPSRFLCIIVAVLQMSHLANSDAAFTLQPLAITLKGITNAPADPSVDVWRTVTLPLLRQATGLSDGFELKIVKRGAEPLVSPNLPYTLVNELKHLYFSAPYSCVCPVCKVD